MPSIRLPLSLQQFRQLPRNAAYRYEYLEGKAHLTPRPKHYHALLDLRPATVHTAADVRPVAPADWPALEAVFAAVFQHIQPFGSIDDDTRLEAARQALERTRTGGDGPWIAPASFVAREGKERIGAALVTLLPPGDPCDWSAYRWSEPPPPDAVARRIGRPHLTWIFVSPRHAGQGLGTALLARVSNALLELGYDQLASTFMLGNDSSMLWHWRNGFRLLTHPASARYRP